MRYCSILNLGCMGGAVGSGPAGRYGLVALVILATSLTAAAQDLTDELYGRGVHFYNAGRYHEAVGALTQAIDAGSQDPRVYYFRGLAQLKQGFDGSAEDDFRMGGELEASDTNSYYPVNRSLYRIQGADRHRLEQLRSEAISAVRLEREMQRRMRTQISPGNEQDVLREPIAPPRAIAPRPSTKPPTPPPTARPRGPAAKPLSKPPAEPEPPADENPFSDEDGMDAPLRDEPADSGLDDLDSSTSLDGPANTTAERGGGRGGAATGSKPLATFGKALGETLTKGFFGGAGQILPRVMPRAPGVVPPGRTLPPPGSFPGDPNAPAELFPPDFDSTLDDQLGK